VSLAVAKRALPLSRVYCLLEPGPVVLLTTAFKGRPNIMTLSWHMMIEFEPPLVGCIVSNRNHSFENLVATRECVINLPTVELAKQVVGCGNCSGRRVDKFKRFGLTAAKASRVGAPLIAECYANLECKVIDMTLREAYNLFILEVLKGWIDRTVKNPRTIHHRGRGAFMVAGETLKLRSRMK
jgi:flavin reductase (DIM6/NTAB) family NADH-FMN oxidoreductase RutF